jgi:hypothetical protein
MGMTDTQNRKLKAFVLGGFTLLAIVWALMPLNIVFNSQSVCLHYRWFGIQCPFCGLSRAGYEMLHFRLSEAWLYNPLIFYVGWLYTLEWGTLLNYPSIFRVRKISWWFGLGLMVTIYGVRFFK